jgi:hypothetical protein
MPCHNLSRHVAPYNRHDHVTNDIKNLPNKKSLSRDHNKNIHHTVSHPSTLHFIQGTVFLHPVKTYLSRPYLSPE